MRFDIYAIGQYSENYGAHDWNGEGACPQYWKAKGSATTLVTANVGLEELGEARDAAEKMIGSGSLNESNDYSSSQYYDMILVPAGCNHQVRFAVERKMTVSDLLMFSHNLSEEDAELYREWCRYFGDDHLIDA